MWHKARGKLEHNTVTDSDFAWPSVTVKQGSTVVKGRPVVKCSWSDNYGTLLEMVVSEFSAV